QILSLFSLRVSALVRSGKEPDSHGLRACREARSTRICGRSWFFASAIYPELRENLLLDLERNVWVLNKKATGVFHTLAQLVAVVGVPGTALLDEPLLHAVVDERALTRYSNAVENIE